MSTESTNGKDPLRPGMMSNDLIQTLIDNYRKGHVRAINSTLGIEDAHSIWFDLPKLKKFIATIEDEAKNANPDTTEEDLGIRFYYAAYPKAENWDIMDSHPVAKEYAEKHTIVMVPTLKKQDETGQTLHFDFNPVDANDANSMALNARKANLSIIAENSGSLIPPGVSIVESFD
ncbi:hypothetical protein VUJ46_18050 [Chryseobacterium sp. MYb264]|uniref:hypothetical protein n=1 Tax=Chryseobacterium sp. MYb264 TaxID=2745153 RepID=UPI002E145C28|nr:hypothetical protein VUJ46_18050 [Chryseobacterium sp. MYb264]